MNNLTQYIIEKLRINKDTDIKADELQHIVDEIVELCDIESDDNDTIKLISDWVKDGKYKIISRITDLTYLKKDGKENLLTHREKFFDDPSRARDIYVDLIVNKSGNEVLTGGWKDPKIYYNRDILIYHDYKKYNLDKIFIKENE